MVWKQHKLHKNLAKNFVKILSESGRRSIKRYWLVEAYGKIKIESVKDWQRGQLLKQIPKMLATRNKRLIRQEFEQISIQILFQSCFQYHIQLREKKEALVQFNKSKKQALIKIRQQIKSIRITVEQARNTKNSQQKKKDKDINRVTVMEAGKNLEIKIKEEIVALIAQRKELDEKENQVGFRYQLRFRSDCAESACFQFVRILMAHNQKTIKMSALQHLIPSDLMKAFCQSVAYLEMENNILQMKIDFYETGESKTEESDYYELHYENKVLKEIISCFINKEYSNYKLAVVKNKTEC